MRSRGLLGVFSTGLNDNAQLRSIISKYMTERLLDEIATQYRLGRRLLIQTTNIDAQRPVIWDLSALSASDRPDRRELTINILLASAAIPAVFPPVRIKVQTPAGESYDELHVDGGVSAQLFFAPPNVRFGNFEREAFGRVRLRHLHVIRNGRLTPTYETTTERTIPLAKRAIETLVAYQGLADLYRLQAFARRGRAELSYVSIPQTFTQTPRSEFDKSYMLSLFEAGVQTGFAGEWKAEVSATLASGG